jgi:hypothetical protein
LQRTPTVSVQPFSVDTIGYAINVPVLLSDAASNLMYLTITVQGDLNNVLAVQPRRLLINAGVTSLYFQLTVSTVTVPTAITLNFALTSFYTVVHSLHPQSMTLQFFQSTTSANRNPPALRAVLAAQPQLSAHSDVGLPVMNVNVIPATLNASTVTAAMNLVLPKVITTN